MNLYTTLIKSINPLTNELTTFGGPVVPGINMADAFEYCQQHGLGYCMIEDICTGEIPCDDNYKADWSKAVDYENFKLN